MFTKADIEKYFNEEKKESLLFVWVGITAVLTGLVFLILRKSDFYTGTIIPLAGVGLILFIVGFTIYRRSDKDRIRNVYAFDMNLSELRDKELPRMKAVIKNFVIYRYTEMILAAGGIGLFIYYRNDPAKAFWTGFGGSLALMALIALVADFFAEQRAKVYTRGLESFINKTKRDDI